MDEEQMMEFINWLSANVEQFHDMEPEKIAETINDLSKTDEGAAMVQKLAKAYMEEKGGERAAEKKMFRSGGKVDSLVRRYGRYVR
jgi:hypothetical protein